MKKQVEHVYCTLCEKEFDDNDYSMGDNRYDILVNYPSEHDCERLKINLCVDCFDRVLDWLIPQCKLNPVVDEDWTDHCTVRELIEKGHNIYQQIFLQDFVDYFGKDALIDFLETDADALNEIYSLRTCLWHRRELIKKTHCENIIPISVGNTDFYPEIFIEYEKKFRSIEEYSLYRELYDEHYCYLLDSYKPWEYEEEFCIVKPPKDIAELLRVCDYDDQGNQRGPFINRCMYGELRVLLAKERSTGKVIEYYYILDNNMICVTMQEEEEQATASIADSYADRRNLTLLTKQKDFVFREDSFLEALTLQCNMGRRVL